jgi:hypothetical protein
LIYGDTKEFGIGQRHKYHNGDEGAMIVFSPPEEPDRESHADYVVLTRAEIERRERREK